jgi:hypothetical protein
MKRALTLQLAALLFFVATSRAADKEEGFVSLFDGKTMKGWKINENPGSWKVIDGALVCKGPRSHLFYMGDDKPFVNFHLKVDVLTKPGSNSGIYFHTKFQKSGWPKAGFEAQVNNSHGDPKRTGSLYAVVNVTKAPAKDNEWFTEEVIVQGKKITIKVDGKTLVDYTEPEGKKPGPGFTRKIDQGTFAFQAHDPKSEVHFKNVRVKRLP